MSRDDKLILIIDILLIIISCVNLSLGIAPGRSILVIIFALFSLIGCISD